MRRNVEWKARLRDPEAALQAAQAAGAEDRGTLRQRDTYFHVPSGRLKLREQAPGGAELIQYARDDAAEARPSDYRLIAVEDPAALCGALTAALGVRAVVEKRRRLLVQGSTRVHLDTVVGLGDFAEIEVVLGPFDDVDEAHVTAEHWRTILGVAVPDVLAVSYAELVLEAGGRTGSPADAR
jgi:adenylate cyclase class IV